MQPYSVVQAYCYWNDQSGEFKHRILWPGQALSRSGRFAVENVHLYHPHFWEQAVNADLVILHFLHQSEVLRLIRERRTRGKPTLYEIPDNFLALGSFADASLRDPLRRQNIFFYASLCDGVQFTTEELALRFRFTHQNQIVLSNQLPQAPPPLKARKPPFVFGWGGSHSHTDDLAYMAGGVRRFCARHKDAVFAYMGDRGNFETFFAEIPAAQKRFTPFGPMADYLRFIESLHVGIAVVAPSGFSACRSDVKYLEYAAHGVAPLLSRAPLYQAHGESGERARLFGDEAELEHALETLYQNPDQCRRLAERAHDYAQGRTHDTHVGERRVFYEGLMAARPGTGTPPPLADQGPLLSRLPVLAPLMAENRHEEALQHIEGLLALAPDYPYGRFCRLKTRFLMGKHHWPALLEQWREQAPPPLYADRVYELLFRMACGLDLPTEAERYLAAIDDPVRTLHLREGEAQDVRHQRAVLAENPFDFQALNLLAEILGGRRVVGAEAEQAAATACLILPESEALQQRLSRIKAARARRGRR